jgi:hypothetical protein
LWLKVIRKAVNNAVLFSSKKMDLNTGDKDISVKLVDMYFKIELVRSLVIKTSNSYKNSGMNTVLENKHMKNSQTTINVVYEVYRSTLISMNVFLLK